MATLQHTDELHHIGRLLIQMAYAVWRCQTGLADRIKGLLRLLFRPLGFSGWGGEGCQVLHAVFRWGNNSS